MSYGMFSGSQNEPVEPRGKARRGQQKRACETREALLETAIELFSTRGYDGVSIRALEVQADVQRGAVAYHFENKEQLWRTAIDRLTGRAAAYFDPLEQTLQVLDEDERVRAMIAVFIRFSAETPELSRLMVQEGRHDSWRLQYIIETFSRRRITWADELTGWLRNPHIFYIVIGASTLVFDVEYECRHLFDVDPTTDEFIREHASQVADVFSMLKQRHQEKRRKISIG